MGYTLELKPSQIQHEQAGQGLFIDGEADVGSVIALYQGVIYSPAYYRYIPGYPGQPPSDNGSDRVWKMLSKPLEGSRLASNGEILERRNPLALAHFANHPATGMEPNVMVYWYALRAFTSITHEGRYKGLLTRVKPE
ncbi:hypothetical protein CTI12_AA033200 [Artemisia annua]|uniref:Uncharacterized protein n=1 Tax=Artemisia annua TaxID=35608 RepID=A0A2U1QGC8_ARTAN|nr:hypothetical protein CTI12_AA033200 [Artemisia annua]